MSTGCHENQAARAAKEPERETRTECDGGEDEACDAGASDVGADSPRYAIPKRCARLTPPEDPSSSLCTVGTLDEFCAREARDRGVTCPKTIDEAIGYVCSWQNPEAPTYFTHCNTCGGVNVRKPWGFGGFYFSFNADAELVGATFSDDAPTGPCRQIESIYGRSCGLTDDADLLRLVACPQ